MTRYFIVEIFDMNLPRFRAFLDKGPTPSHATARNIEPLDGYSEYRDAWHSDIGVVLAAVARHHGRRDFRCHIEIEYCQ